jgi:hypothetical protein
LLEARLSRISHIVGLSLFVSLFSVSSFSYGSLIARTENINLYNIVCDSLGIQPSPNNGTLRLPFKVTGLHSDPKAPALEAPDDLPTTGTGPTVVKPSLPTIPSDPEIPTKPVKPSKPAKPSPPAKPAEPEKPGQDENHGKPGSGSWWEWLSDKVDEAKDLIKGIFGSSKSSKDDE